MDAFRRFLMPFYPDCHIDFSPDIDILISVITMDYFH